MYQLRERGTTLRRLSRQNGYAPSSAAQVFFTAWPAMQKCIADALGVEPWDIWPSRYNPDGTPKPRADVLRLIARQAKSSTGTRPVNVNRRRAA